MTDRTTSKKCITEADLWLVREELMRTLLDIKNTVDTNNKHFQDVLDKHYFAIENLTENKAEEVKENI